MSAPRSAEEILGAVREAGLLGHAGDGPLLLMCSAGRDSHALLDLAVRLRGPGELHVLHVDHGLRPGATVDAEQLGDRCGALGVAMTVERARPRQDGDRNLHAWARDERRRLVGSTATRLGAALIATAHTRSDLVETALGRLATQPGRRALLSMRAREGGLVRPLLTITREETAAYCRARGILWRDDPSNDDERYARARLRHGVVPVLRALNPRAEETVARTLEELALESAVLDELVDGALEPPGPGEDGPSISAAALAGLAPALGRLVLRTLCERTLGAPCPRAASRLEAVLALEATAARAGLASVDVGSGARVELRGGVVRCRRSTGSAARAT